MSSIVIYLRPDNCSNVFSKPTPNLLQPFPFDEPSTIISPTYGTPVPREKWEFSRILSLSVNVVTVECCTLYTVNCQLHTGQCTLCTVRWILYTVHRMLCIVHWLHTVHWTICTVHCIDSKPCTKHCIVYTVPCSKIGGICFILPSFICFYLWCNTFCAELRKNRYIVGLKCALRCTQVCIIV